MIDGLSIIWLNGMCLVLNNCYSQSCLLSSRSKIILYPVLLYYI